MPAKNKILANFVNFLIFKNLLINLGVLILYILAGKFGLSLASVNPSATAIWAPTGIALSAFMFFGNRALPAIFLGAFFVNITTAGGFPTSLAIAFGNTLEGAFGAHLVKKYAGGIHAFDNILNIAKYVFFAGVVSTMVSADIGTATLVLGKLAKWNEFLPIWTTWWLGDMGGNLIVAPLFLTWLAHPTIHKGSFKKLTNFIVSFALIFIVSEIVFRGIIPYEYICIPIGVWIAFWFGRRGASFATLLVAAIAVFYTIRGFGPFSHEATINQSLILLQAFLGIFSITTLTFGSIINSIRKSEKALSSTEARFRALIENSFDGIVLIDPTAKILYASPSIKRILGYNPEDLIGKNGFNLVSPKHRKMTMAKLAELVLKPGGTVTVEYQSIRKDKKEIWVESTGTNLLLEENVNAVVINFRDITQEKINREEILQAKMEDESMLKSIGDGVIATDKRGRITMVNQAACDALGWTENELIGKFVADSIPMENEEEKVISVSERPISKVLSLGEEIVSAPTIYYVRRDKTKFPVHFTVTPIILEGRTVGSIEVFRDITKEAQIDRAKTEFVSLASHQLRTPLTIINWCIERLMNKSVTDEAKIESYINEIYDASRRMGGLINSLLNVSRLELGTFTVEPEAINVRDLADRVLRDLAPQIEKKHINLEKKYQENIDPITADPKLLTIIIQNLISNAVKYNNPEGKLTVEITSSANEFIIKVSDTGCGIPASAQSKIFSKMFRADNARTADPDGTGLGLYIAKAICDETGGKIWFVSEKNKGTDFFVSFPSSGMKKREGKDLLLS